jgi:hypothetical protein
VADLWKTLSSELIDREESEKDFIPESSYPVIQGKTRGLSSKGRMGEGKCQAARPDQSSDSIGFTMLDALIRTSIYSE